MNNAVKEAAGMAVDAFAEVLIGCLQIEIGHRVLEHQDGRGDKDWKGKLGH